MVDIRFDVPPRVDTLDEARNWITILNHRSVEDYELIRVLTARIERLEQLRFWRRFYRRLREVGATW